MNRFIGALLIMISLTTIAQDDANIGLKIGLGQHTLYGSDIPSNLQSFERRESLMAGLGINSELSEYFWMKHEFIWSNKGATWVDQSGTKVERKRMHIDIMPIIFTFHVKGIQVFAGPYGSLMFYRDDKITSGVTVEELTKVEDTGFFDFGGLAGIEYELPFGLNAGIRYYQGFAKDDDAYTLNIHHRGLYYTVGWTFGAND